MTFYPLTLLEKPPMNDTPNTEEDVSVVVDGSISQVFTDALRSLYPHHKDEVTDVSGVETESLNAAFEFRQRVIYVHCTSMEALGSNLNAAVERVLIAEEAGAVTIGVFPMESENPPSIVAMETFLAGRGRHITHQITAAAKTVGFKTGWSA